MAAIVSSEDTTVVGSSFTNDDCVDKEWLRQNTGIDVDTASIAALV